MVQPKVTAPGSVTMRISDLVIAAAGCLIASTAASAQPVPSGYQAPIVIEELVATLPPPGRPKQTLPGSGNRIAFVVSDRGGEYVRIDGKDGPRYGSIDQASWSRDGTRFLYRAARVSREGLGTPFRAATGIQRQFVVVDGREGKEYGDVKEARFSPDGKHFSYAFTAPPLGGAECPCTTGVVVDSTEYPYGAVEFSPDGTSHVLLRAVKGDMAGARLIGNGPRLVPRDASSAYYAYAFYSPDGARLALVTLPTETLTPKDHARFLAELLVMRTVYSNVAKFRLAIDDTVTAGLGVHPFRNVVFSPDGKHVAYVGLTEDKRQTAMLDGIPVGTVSEDIGRSVFSPDGTRLVFAEKPDVWVGWRTNVCDVLTHTCEKHENPCGFDVVFSPDSKHLATGGGLYCVNVDGVVTQTGFTYKYVSPPVFVDDRTNIAYTAMKYAFLSGDPRWFIVVDFQPVRADGKELSYDSITDLQKTTDGTLQFIGIRRSKQDGTRVYRVTVRR